MYKRNLTLTKYLSALLVAFAILFFSACSLTRYVPEGEYLVSKVRIISDNKDIKPNESKSYVRQEPNHKTFGFIPLPLGLYSMSGEDTTKWVNKFLRRCGSAPQIR